VTADQGPAFGCSKLSQYSRKALSPGVWKNLWKSLWKTHEVHVKTSTCVILATFFEFLKVFIFQYFNAMSLMINVLARFDSLRQSTTPTFRSFCGVGRLLVAKPLW
jgi:hypothetical protein